MKFFVFFCCFLFVSVASESDFINFLEHVVKNEGKTNCTEDIEILLRGWKEPKVWALKFLESSGNFPKDRYEFDDVFEIGDFDQCIYSNFEENGRKIQGKHCTTDINVPKVLIDQEKLPKLGFSSLGQMKYTWGICVPKSCPMEEMNKWLRNSNFVPTNMSINFEEKGCRIDGSYQLETADIITIVVSSILVAVVMVSTFLEMFGKELIYSKIFSLITNAKELFKIDPVKRNGSVFFSLYGFRAMSIIVIIYYHLAVILGNFPHWDYYLELDSWTMIPLLSGTLPVDVFFVMSGLLCMFQILKRYKEGVKIKDVPNYILHRYFRYTPMILCCIGIYLFYGNYVRSKTIPSVDYIVEPCQKVEYLWENFLFVHNYLWPYTHSGELSCMIHTWYLAVEFQLYLFTLVLLFLIQKVKKIAYPLLIGLSILPSVFIIMAATKYEIVDVAMAHNYTLYLLQQQKIYYFTHERAAPYFIGMVLGYYLYHNKNRYLNKMTVIFLWILTIGAILGILLLHLYLAQQFHHYDPVGDPTFEGFHRTIFSIGIALLIFLCESGYGGIVDKVLSFKYWQPFGKLTYGVYLLHLLYIFSFYKQFNGPIKYSQFLEFNAVISVYIVVVVLAMPLYLFVELPFCKIGKLFFDRKK